MNIIKIVISVVVMCLLVFPIKSYGFLWNDFKPGSEPDGFRGIKWGQDISTLKDMIFFKDAFPFDGSIKEYKRSKDVLKIGIAKLKNMEYSFWDGKFYYAFAEFEGSKNWETIKNVCFKMFGEKKIKIWEYKGTRKDGSRYETRKEDYTWEGENTSLNIIYWHCLNYGSFGISSTAMGEKDLLRNMKKAREREGF